MATVTMTICDVCRRMGSNLIPMLRYAWITLKHKWFVLQAGRRLQVPFRRLLIHDLSKFSPAELPHYTRQFYGSKDDPEGWRRCWAHHVAHNPHHWESWLRRSVGKPEIAVPMPEIYVREMLADWLAAGRAYEGKWPTFCDWPWLEKNWNKMHLHPKTRALLLAVLSQAGYELIAHRLLRQAVFPASDTAQRELERLAQEAERNMRKAIGDLGLSRRGL